MDIILVLAVYAYFFLVDGLPAMRSKKPGIRWPCLALFCAGFAVEALYLMKVAVPSPAITISNLFTNMFNLK